MVLIVLGSVQRKFRVEIYQGLLTSLELPVALKSIKPVPSRPPSLPGSFSFPTIPPFNPFYVGEGKQSLKTLLSGHQFVASSMSGDGHHNLP